MDTARIAALLDPFLGPSLPPSQIDQISTYIDLLLRWNARYPQPRPPPPRKNRTPPLRRVLLPGPPPLPGRRPGLRVRPRPGGYPVQTRLGRGCSWFYWVLGKSERGR